MNTKAKIIGKFDLGYLLELESGKVAQLRVIEMKGEELEHHLNSQEEILFGKEILVEVIFEDEEQALLSQFTKEERDEKERAFQLKKEALKTFEIGEKKTFKVIQELDWGFICEEVGGYLEAAIKDKSILSLSESFLGEIIGKTEIGYPIIKQTKA